MTFQQIISEAVARRQANAVPNGEISRDDTAAVYQ
jgi:hypothetical protein